MEIDKCRIKGFVSGMLLGDGCIGKSKNTCYFIMQHSDKQKEYFFHKVKLLEELTKVRVREIPPRGNKHPNIEWAGASRTHPIYKRLRELFYPEGKRKITKCFLSWLTLEGIALWYMDDGRLDSHNSVSIALGDRSEEECYLVIRELNNRFGFKFFLKKYPNKAKTKVYHALTSNYEYGRAFINAVTPYIENIPNMDYKLHYKRNSE